MSEFVDGFHELAEIGPAVSIFGISRTKTRRMAQARGKRLAPLVKEGTLSLPAAARGSRKRATKAASAKGQSIGLNIDSPFEQSPTVTSTI